MAVGLDGQTYNPGDEEELLAALDALDEEEREKQVERMIRHGALIEVEADGPTTIDQFARQSDPLLPIKEKSEGAYRAVKKLGFTPEQLMAIDDLTVLQGIGDGYAEAIEAALGSGEEE